MNPRRYLTGEEYPNLPSDAPLRPRLPYVERVDPDFIEDESGSLLEYWRILLRRKGTILVIAFLGALTGLLVTLPQSPVYRSWTTLEIQPLNENLLNTREVDPNAGALPLDSFLKTQLKLLESPSLIDRVVAKLKLEQRADSLEQAGHLSIWRKALGLPESEPATAHEQAVDMASGSVTVQLLAQTRIVEIICDSTDPRLAAAFVNTLANEFIEQSMEVRSQTSQRTGDWLTRQVEDLKIKLEKSEDQLQSYAVASNLTFTGEKGSVDEDKLRQLQGELAKAQAERITRQSPFGITLSSKPEALPEVLDNGPLREYQVKLTDLRRELAGLGASFTPAHYKVQRVQAQIDELQSAIGKERGNILNRIRNEYEAALRREKLLAAAYASESKLVSDQVSKATQYNILKREADTNRQIYDAMRQKVREFGIASAMPASNTRVIDPARPPGRPYKPDIVRNSGLGLLAGLLLGVVFVFIREHADRSLQLPGDAPLYLNLPELGAIPSARLNPTKRLDG